MKEKKMIMSATMVECFITIVAYRPAQMSSMEREYMFCLLMTQWKV